MSFGPGEPLDGPLIPAHEIEITKEMISAAAEVLWKDPFLGLGPSSAEEIARKMLMAALVRLRNRHTDFGP
jgi:hypothetical protein